MRDSAIFQQPDHARNFDRRAGGVHVSAGMFLSRGYALEHQHQRAPGRADVDWLEARIQHQHGPVQAFLVNSDHACAPCTVENVSSIAARRSVRANASKHTCAAPARFKTRAQALAVAPVVTTSSTSRM